MGITFNFYCKTCDTSHEVAGGQTGGFLVSKQTVYCSQCKKLVDINIGKSGEARPVEEREPMNCYRCKVGILKPWYEGSPCPKCEDTMENRGEVMMWD